MKLRHIVMAVGFVAAAGLAIFGDKSPADHVVEPVARAATTMTPSHDQTLLAAINSDTRASKNTPSSDGAKPEPVILVLLTREEAMHKIVSTNNSTLFGNQNWLPPAPPPPKPVPPPPPTAPSMPFTYLGKKMEDGVWEVYLARGDTIAIVHTNSLIEATYRVDSITPPTLTMTYLPLKQTQTITVGDAE
ncbi:hypothetical protein [Solimicrobium silvestre]|uniref:Prolin-rich transmembrane protein n=1 Tax=Solimicrobium silvestre TaxID=2099400 RepID=A0A2S9GYG0_9BURK|nr:hypothetical protein [Solimicrobium silvestre]PRC92696.1 hypothetical protein S2091_2751 [Solimicrobium silvestre]